MPLLGPSFFILGLVMASAMENDAETESPTVSLDNDESANTTTNISSTTTKTNVNSITSISSTTTKTNVNSITSISSTTSSIITNGNTTVIPLTTKEKGGKTTQRPTTSVITPAPISPKRVTSASTTTKHPPEKSRTAGGDIIGIIIFIVIIIVALVFGIACYITRRRGRRYSVDFTARPDEANIPLSTIEPDLPGDTVPQNGLQTFESVEPTTKELQEPEAKPEVQEEQKTEADKSVVDPSAESAAPAPSPDNSEDKPKEDVVEQSPPAPVQPSTEEKTDDEGAVSNKTSVESLKEANGNNSNNADLSLKRDLESGYIFLDVPLDSQV